MYEITQRTTEPYRTVCYITCTWSDGSRTAASGVVVGVNDVLTAMHVVFNQSRGGWATQISISPGADTKPYLVQPLGEFNDWGRLSSRTMDWDRNGDDLIDQAEAQWDLAVIGLRTRIGDVTGWAGTSATDESFRGEVVGYPSRGTGMMGEQVLATASSRYGVFNVDTSLGAGASGGPLYQTRSDGIVYAVGVLSAGDNSTSTYAALYGAGTWDWLSGALAGNNDLISGAGAGAGAGGTGSVANPTPARDDFAASAQTLGALALGSVVTGRLETVGDVDWFKVTLAVGNYRFEVRGEGANGGSLGDPLLTLRSAAGLQLAQDDDSGAGLDALLQFGVSVAGVYYLAVSAPALSPSTIVGSYTVSATPLGGGAAAWGIAPGTAGNDTVASTPRDDRFDGGAGIDRWVLDGIRADYNVATAAGTGLSGTPRAWTVQDRVAGRDGRDTVVATERLVFTDRVVALDLQLDDSAGRAALLLGVALGPQALLNRGLVGSMVQYFDSGVSLQQASQWLVGSGVMAQLAGGADNLSFVRHVFRNVVGELPSAQTASDLAQYLQAGTFTQAGMFEVLAQMPLNQAHIDLVGLQRTGLEYIGL